MPKRLHKIYTEIYRSLDRVWFTFELKGKFEYYLGTGAMFAVQKTFLWFKWMVYDLQSLRMIAFPPILHHLMAVIVDNQSTYNEENDTYNQVSLSDVYQAAIDGMQDSIAAIANNAIATMDPNDIQFKLLMSRVAQLKKQYQADTAHEVNRASGVVRELMDDGFFPFWTEYAIRTRTILLVRQADANTFVLSEVKEFIPRDQRQSCSFISLTTVQVDHNVANEVKFDIVIPQKGTVI